MDSATQINFSQLSNIIQSVNKFPLLLHSYLHNLTYQAIIVPILYHLITGSSIFYNNSIKQQQIQKFRKQI